jgi:hypothetical protein
MSYRDARLLNLLLREASSDAYFQRRLEFPALVFAAGREGHALQASDEDSVQKRLQKSISKKGEGGEGNIPHLRTPATPSPAPRHSIVSN